MRPSELTPDAKKRILLAIRAGIPKLRACHLAGISRAVFYKWCQEGEEGKSPEHETFLRELREAEQAAEIRIVGIISAAAESDWHAAGWLAERTRPDAYGVRQAIEMRVGERLASELKAIWTALQDALDPQTFDRVAAVLSGLGASPSGDEEVGSVGDE